MKPLLIRGGRIIDPRNGIDKTGDLFIDKGKISPWEKSKPPQPDYEIIDAKGMIVCPGFIDFHCHLRQPGFEEKETIATGTTAAAGGGFTTVCCMPNTKPPADSAATIHYIRDTAAKEGIIRVLPIGCVTLGRKGTELANLEELKKAGVVGYSDDGDPVRTPQLMRQALEYSRESHLPIIDHCENKVMSEGGQVNEGMVSLELGLRGIPAAAEESIVSRDIALARQTGGRLHIAHTSTAVSVEMIRRAKVRGARVTAEVTPHHLTLTEDEALGYNTNAKVSPPLRTQKDIDALITGLNDGTIDIIATDHAPHSEADKSCEFALAASGISGFETALGSLMGLVHDRSISLNTLIAKMTSEPAKLIKGKKLGTLAAGARADITIFDTEREWVVNPKLFASKGRNTPLAGRTLKGKVMATIYGGKVVYKDERIKITGSK
jgi:dihydroorotase